MDERFVLDLPKGFDVDLLLVKTADAFYDLDDRKRLKDRFCDDETRPLSDEEVSSFDDAVEVTPLNVSQALTQALLRADKKRLSVRQTCLGQNEPAQ